MKYYIKELDEFNIKKLILEKENTIYKILTGDCLIKEHNGKLYKYEIHDNNADIRVDNFIKNYTLLGTDFYEKKLDQIFHIPFDHHLLNIKQYVYSLKGGTKFMVEYQDGKMIDFYFKSSEHCTNFSLKEDIYSFLSILM